MSALRKVGLNALFLEPDASGGLETYLRELVPALARTRPDVRLHVVTNRSAAQSLRDAGWGELAQITGLAIGSRPMRLTAEQLMLPSLARRHGWDLLHSLANLAPLRPGVASAVTLHDLIFARTRTMTLPATLAWRVMVPPALRRADWVLTGTRTVRDEACASFGVPAGRVAVVPLGPGRAPAANPAPEAEVRARLGLGDARVVVHVGTGRPHKNRVLLVRALEHLPADAIVVLAGSPQPGEPDLLEQAARLGVADRLRVAGWLDAPLLEGLWRTAACAAFPTLAEGFCLPVLEAMRRGVPVACADLPVLREVAGDASRFFDPTDPGAAGRAIMAAMNDDGAAGAGRENARRFSWAQAAEGTFEAYERALRRRACTLG